MSHPDLLIWRQHCCGHQSTHLSVQSANPAVLDSFVSEVQVNLISPCVARHHVYSISCVIAPHAKAYSGYSLPQTDIQGRALLGQTPRELAFANMHKIPSIDRTRKREGRQRHYLRSSHRFPRIRLYVDFLFEGLDFGCLGKQSYQLLRVRVFVYVHYNEPICL